MNPGVMISPVCTIDLGADPDAYVEPAEQPADTEAWAAQRALALRAGPCSHYLYRRRCVLRG